MTAIKGKTSPSTTAVANWYGSNRMGAPRVGELLRGCEHVSIGFAGGMAELPEIDARQILVNDLHRHVINLARVMADDEIGPVLYRQLRRLPFHPEILERAQAFCSVIELESSDKTGLFGGQKLDAMYAGDKLEWAKAYFLTTWMGRGGKGGIKDEFKGGLPVRYDAGGGGSVVRFQSATSSIPAWRRILRRCEFTTLDIFEFLSRIHDEPGHGLYCDPPFPGPGDAYRHQLGELGQQRLAAAVSKFDQCRVVMRFYDVPLVRQLYSERQWRFIPWTGRKQSNGDAPEVLLVRNGGAE